MMGMVFKRKLNTSNHKIFENVGTIIFPDSIKHFYNFFDDMYNFHYIHICKIN